VCSQVAQRLISVQNAALLQLHPVTVKCCIVAVATCNCLSHLSMLCVIDVHCATFYLCLVFVLMLIGCFEMWICCRGNYQVCIQLISPPGVLNWTLFVSMMISFPARPDIHRPPTCQRDKQCDSEWTMHLWSCYIYRYIYIYIAYSLASGYISLASGYESQHIVSWSASLEIRMVAAGRASGMKMAWGV